MYIIHRYCDIIRILNMKDNNMRLRIEILM